jgi:hypothetical protein
MAPNPPDGAILDYFLREPVSEVTLEIIDGAGRVARRYSSRDVAEPIRDEGNIPRWWIRKTAIPPATAGLHRFVWDLHYAPPAVIDRQYPIAAVPLDTPKEPRGPWAPPGKYTVRLTAGGHTVTQPLWVRMDPRVKTSAGALAEQFQRSLKLADALEKEADVLGAVRKQGGQEALAKDLIKHNARLASVYQILQDADSPTTAQTVQAVNTVLRETADFLVRWEKIKKSL